MTLESIMLYFSNLALETTQKSKLKNQLQLLTDSTDEANFESTN